MIGNTTFGFGSSSPRFPKKLKDSTPGPGSYDPKPIAKQIKGGSAHFKRHPQKGLDFSQDQLPNFA